VRDVVDARDLNADEDRARHGRFSFHDRGGSTNRAGRDGDGATPRLNDPPPPPMPTPRDTSPPSTPLATLPLDLDPDLWSGPPLP
jgi:hypothetical protein